MRRPGSSPSRTPSDADRGVLRIRELQQYRHDDEADCRVNIVAQPGATVNVQASQDEW